MLLMTTSNSLVSQLSSRDEPTSYPNAILTSSTKLAPASQVCRRELIIIKEGAFEVMQNGKVSEAGPGSVIFEASNEMHGMRNVGDVPGTYFVVKFWPPGMLSDPR
jgi:hypothetical protein